MSALVTRTDQVGDLRELLVCAKCQGNLQWGTETAICHSCKERYWITEGIPILLRESSRTAYKNQQATSHDKSDMPDEQEFEMIRPVHAPAFYGWLLSEKYRRSVIGLEQIIPNATALVSCGGSGMDAHFLAVDGARVISIDISVGAALRTARRAKHFGLPILSIVADAEYLPLVDLSVDLAYVHDGLHHLEKPEIAITEMARVARRGVSITEPARATATMVAVKFGAAEAIEESGNHVRRFRLSEVQDWLRTLGFETVKPHRYVMWYRHAPGHIVCLLSRPGLKRFGGNSFHLANHLIGRSGNKLTVQAKRVR
jgi:uncharacterized protein YbaR (Trm112 family)